MEGILLRDLEQFLTDDRFKEASFLNFSSNASKRDYRRILAVMPQRGIIVAYNDVHKFEIDCICD